MIEQNGVAIDTGLMESGVEIHVEIQIAVVDDHGWSLDAEIPADLSALCDVRGEGICTQYTFEYF